MGRRTNQHRLRNNVHLWGLRYAWALLVCMLLLHSEWEAVQKSCESSFPCQHVARQYLGLPQRSMLSHILRIEREVGSCVNAFPKRFQTVIARGSYLSKPFQRGERCKGECTKVYHIQKFAGSLSKWKISLKSPHCCHLTLWKDWSTSDLTLYWQPLPNENKKNMLKKTHSNYYLFTSVSGCLP